MSWAAYRGYLALYRPDGTQAESPGLHKAVVLGIIFSHETSPKAPSPKHKWRSCHSLVGGTQSEAQNVRLDVCCQCFKVAGPCRGPICPTR